MIEPDLETVEIQYHKYRQLFQQVDGLAEFFNGISAMIAKMRQDATTMREYSRLLHEVLKDSQELRQRVQKLNTETERLRTEVTPDALTIVHFAAYEDGRKAERDRCLDIVAAVELSNGMCPSTIEIYRKILGKK